MGRVRQGTGGEGPRSTAIRGGSTEQRRAVIDADNAAGRRRAGQRQRIVVRNAVTNRAAVRRIRADCRGARCQRRRGNAVARRRSRASEILSGLGKCGLWNGRRRRDLRDRTRSIRLFPGGRHPGRSAPHLLKGAETSKIRDAATELTKVGSGLDM